jgi:hypothetical protein
MARIDIDIEDYLDEVDTDSLIEELKSRRDLPREWQNLKKLGTGNVYHLNNDSASPRRDLIINILRLHPSATIEDIQEAVKENFNK